MAASALAQVIRSDETFQVTLIEVPVSVTTANGEPVRGLTKENFEVYDLGQKREITNFDMVDFAAHAGRPAAAAAAAGMGAARRNFMLLFDLGNSDPTSLIRARTAALKFVDEQLLPGDRVAVGTMSPQRGFQLYAVFSTDRKLVREAVNTLGLPQFHMSGDALLMTMSDLGGQSAGQTGSSTGVTANAKAGLVVEDLQEISLGTQRASDENQRQYVLRQVKDFSNMGRVLDRVAGRKEVILLSEGFDPKMLQGRRASSTSDETQKENASVENGEIWNVASDSRFGSTEAQSGLQRMVEALRRSDVVLNAIDIKGLRGTIDAREGISSKTNDSLFLLTRDTGGQVFRNANDLGQDFSRMLKSHEVTYVLGFSGADKNPGKFHNIKVKIVNTPGARISHRAGYYEPTPVASDFDRLLTAGEIIMNSIPVDDVTVAAMATPFPRKDGAADVPVIVQVGGKSLLEGAKGTSIQAEFFMYAFDAQELIRDYSYQRVGMDLGKVRDLLAGNGIKFYGTLNLPPGDYTIRTLVRSGAKNGFTAVPLHVPAPGEPSASIAFHDTGAWLMVKGPERSQGRPYPYQAGDKAIIPTAQPIVASGTYDIALLTYNIAPDNLNVAAHVADAKGTVQAASVSLVGKTGSDPAQGINLLYAFKPPAPIARGDYSLVLDLHDKNGAGHRTVTLPFHVN
jgi:VWFA-related protein